MSKYYYFTRLLYYTIYYYYTVLLYYLLIFIYGNILIIKIEIPTHILLSALSKIRFKFYKLCSLICFMIFLFFNYIFGIHTVQKFEI